MKWFPKWVTPAYDNALVIISLLGHSQTRILMWRNDIFYMENEETGLFTEPYHLQKYIDDWTYFPLSRKDDNYDLYKKVIS